MYHQRVRLHQISMIALGLAILLAVVALVKSFLFLVLMVHYCIAVSLICHGLASFNGIDKQGGLRMLLLGTLLFVTTTYFIFSSN